MWNELNAIHFDNRIRERYRDHDSEEVALLGSSVCSVVVKSVPYFDSSI
jgi:hypothetical protein